MSFRSNYFEDSGCSSETRDARKAAFESYLNCDFPQIPEVGSQSFYGSNNEPSAFKVSEHFPEFSEKKMRIF